MHRGRGGSQGGDHSLLTFFSRSSFTCAAYLSWLGVQAGEGKKRKEKTQPQQRGGGKKEQGTAGKNKRVLPVLYDLFATLPACRTKGKQKRGKEKEK